MNREQAIEIMENIANECREHEKCDILCPFYSKVIESCALDCCIDAPLGTNYKELLEVKHEYKESEEKTVETKRKPATINKDFNDTVQDMINGIMLEEISKKVIADVKGSLGEYHIEDNKVTINNFTFATEKDVDQEIALRRKVIEDQLKELEVMDKEYRAVIKKYIA